MNKKDLEKLDALCSNCSVERKTLTLEEIPSKEAQKNLSKIYGINKQFYYCDKCGDISISTGWEAF